MQARRSEGRDGWRERESASECVCVSEREGDQSTNRDTRLRSVIRNFFFISVFFAATCNVPHFFSPPLATARMRRWHCHSLTEDPTRRIMKKSYRKGPQCLRKGRKKQRIGFTRRSSSAHDPPPCRSDVYLYTYTSDSSLVRAILRWIERRTTAFFSVS